MANRDVVLECAQARALVSDYLDGELTAPQRTDLEAHLASCATCPPLYAALVGVRDLLGGLHDSNSVVPDAIRRRLQADLERPTTEGLAT